MKTIKSKRHYGDKHDEYLILSAQEHHGAFVDGISDLDHERIAGQVPHNRLVDNQRNEQPNDTEDNGQNRGHDGE